MKITELLHGEEYETTADLSKINISNITNDIKKINSSSLFIAYNCINFDIRSKINDIINKKPAAIICECDIEATDSSVPIVIVKNARRTWAFTCYRLEKIDAEKLRFIAVTGTNGKTTTATLIESILMYNGIKVGFIGTGSIRLDGKAISDDFYSMTTPDPNLLYPMIKRMEIEGCEIIVMEVSSHSLALDKVAPINFEIAMFTNLSDEHLDFHKDPEDYYQTKLKLFNQSKNGIFNADDHYSARAMRDSFDKCNTASIGILWEAEGIARDVSLNGLNGVSFLYKEKNLTTKIESPLIGYYNVYNLMMAFKCAISIGIKPCKVKAALKECDRISGRFEIIRDKSVIIVDYAHTEAAFRMLLKTARECAGTDKRIITVFGCGGDRDKSKRPKIGKAVEEFSNFVIITNDNPRSEDPNLIIEDILSGISDKSNVEIIYDRKKAIFRAISLAETEDIVLILGKGREKYIIDSNGYHKYDEIKTVQEALQERKAAFIK